MSKGTAEPPPHDKFALSERDQKIFQQLEENLAQDAIDPFCPPRQRRQRFWLRVWFRRPRRTLILTIAQVFLVSSIVLIAVIPTAAAVLTAYVHPELVGL